MVATGNSTAYGQTISTFTCPSNRSNSDVPFINYSFGGALWSVSNPAITDYVFSAGAMTQIYAPYVVRSKAGIFYFDSKTRISDIVDGTRQTFLMGEAAGGDVANPTYADGYGDSRLCIP